MGPIPIARSSVLVFMISCKFKVSSEILEKLDSFLEEQEFSNSSVFENTELGFSNRLDENGFPIAKFFDVEILAEDTESAVEIETILRDRFGKNILDFKASKLKDEDWVDLYVKELKPVICDKFYFYNEAVQTPPKDSELIPIKLNSALAFGSGHHQTTQTCLLNMRNLSNNGFIPQDILDMGCGTGILGICASKVWKDSKLIGIDIDPEAVRITKENYELNNVNAEALVGSEVSEIRQKFDLIFCNLLKQPLIDLCSGFSRIMNSGSYIVTSGFITSQEEEVLEAYKTEGFVIENRIQLDDWLSIAFKKI